MGVSFDEACEQEAHERGQAQQGRGETEEDDGEEVEGCRVHTWNEGDLIACFAEDVPDSVVREIARRRPLRAVFRDAGFRDSPSRINAVELFKALAPNARLKVL